MIKTKRLTAILNHIENEDVVYDIGADHGHLDYYIILENRAKKVIATDISAKSIEKTAKMAKKCGFDDRIECLVGDGLDVLESGSSGLAVIAGMGGKEISKIITSKNRKDNIDRFILQPAKYGEELRNFLVNNNFNIIFDQCILDKGKFYDTMVVTTGRCNLSREELWFGKTNLTIKTDDFIKKMQKIRQNMLKRTDFLSKTDKEKLKAINKILSLGE